VKDVFEPVFRENRMKENKKRGQLNDSYPDEEASW